MSGYHRLYYSDDHSSLLAADLFAIISGARRTDLLFSRRPDAINPLPPTGIRVATLNVRNRSDRWKERRGMLIEQLAELRPDLIGLQEIRRFPNQGSWIVDRTNQCLSKDDLSYTIFKSFKTGHLRLWEGIAIMTRLPVVRTERLNLLGGQRVAQRVEVAMPGGGTLEMYNSHFHHADGANEIRSIQARMILAWMAQRSSLPKVLVGDFNDVPASRTVGILNDHLRSAYPEVHGVEPERTVPTPLGDNRDEEPRVIDYIFTNEFVDVRDVYIAFDHIDPHDVRLTASDHFGLVADIVPIRSSNEDIQGQ